MAKETNKKINVDPRIYYKSTKEDMNIRSFCWKNNCKIDIEVVTQKYNPRYDKESCSMVFNPICTYRLSCVYKNQKKIFNKAFPQEFLAFYINQAYKYFYKIIKMDLNKTSE